MKRMIKILRCRLQFWMLSDPEKEIMVYLKMDPDSLIERGRL